MALVSAPSGWALAALLLSQRDGDSTAQRPSPAPGRTWQEPLANASQHVFPVTRCLWQLSSLITPSLTFAGYRLTDWSQVDLFDFC